MSTPPPLPPIGLIAINACLCLLVYMKETEREARQGQRPSPPATRHSVVRRPVDFAELITELNRRIREPQQRAISGDVPARAAAEHRPGRGQHDDVLESLAASTVSALHRAAPLPATSRGERRRRHSREGPMAAAAGRGLRLRHGALAPLYRPQRRLTLPCGLEWLPLSACAIRALATALATISGTRWPSEALSGALTAAHDPVGMAAPDHARA